ncbi:MAG: hypothetical protein QN229_02455 [Desulfurococcaceae archaeon TW002]
MTPLNLDPWTATLLLSSVLMFSSLVMYLVYIILSRKTTQSSSDYSEPYIGGEPANIIRSIDVSVRNLFWGIVRGGAGRKLYTFLRDQMHNGVLNDWGIYMVTYIGLLALISFIYFMR